MLPNQIKHPKRANLTEEEQKEIVKLLGRYPTLTEWEIFTALWNEHCSYKSSRYFLKQLHEPKKNVLAGIGDNAGIISVSDDWCVAFKMESHNHPSYIEPMQGAATGVGGILRDIIAMGARPFAILDSLWFPEPSYTLTSHLFNNVVAGVGYYGNCIGVPTVGGETGFHKCYNGNNLVNAFAIGAVRRDKIFRGELDKNSKDLLLLYVGARTGKDGIHGATMASERFSSDTTKKKVNIQISDPFMGKLLMEASLEIMENRLASAVQDMGAAGIASSVFELVSSSKAGFELFLDKVPVREKNMSASEILISESQERMLFAIKKENLNKIKQICDKWDIEHAIIGKINNSGYATIFYQNEVKAYFQAKHATTNAPIYKRSSFKPEQFENNRLFKLNSLPILDIKKSIKKILSHPDFSSKEIIYSQYDYEVGTSTVIKPGADAALIMLDEINNLGIAVTLDSRPVYTAIDPYKGMILIILEAIRNLTCAGAIPVGITDCLNLGNPENSTVMWQFKNIIKALSDASVLLNIPVVSGNVSFYNENKGNQIYPTPVIGMVGKRKDLDFITASYFVKSGDIIYEIGALNREEVGATAFLSIVYGLETGALPFFNLKKEMEIYKTVQELVVSGMFTAIHDISAGGLAMALMEMSLSSPNSCMGFNIKPKNAKRMDFYFFGESSGRFLVTVDKNKKTEFEHLAQSRLLGFTMLGTVEENQMNIQGVCRLNISEMFNAYQKGLSDVAK